MRARGKKPLFALVSGLCLLFLIGGLAYFGQFSKSHNKLIKQSVFEIASIRNSRLSQPDFIEFYGPFPVENIADFSRKEGLPHSRGVRVTMTPKWMDFTPETCDADKLFSRVELYLDGTAVPNDSMVIAVASDGYDCRFFEFTFSWAPDLQAGQHEAEFRIKDDSDHVWRYSWQFSLVAY